MKKYLHLFFVMLFTMSFFTSSAQYSELDDNELKFTSPTLPPDMVYAQYGLGGLTVQEYYNFCTLNPDTLRLGGDINWSILDGQRLKFSTALIVPNLYTSLDLDKLKFEAKGTGDNYDSWSIGRGIQKPNPPKSGFFIQNVNTTLPFGIVETAIYIDTLLNVALGDITPSEKLDVDGNARFRNVPVDQWQHYLGITPNGKLVRISGTVLFDEIKTLRQIIANQQKEIDTLKKMEVKLMDLDKKVHLALEDK
jgi:hypothetical protein